MVALVEMVSGMMNLQVTYTGPGDGCVSSDGIRHDEFTGYVGCEAGGDVNTRRRRCR